MESIHVLFVAVLWWGMGKEQSFVKRDGSEKELFSIPFLIFVLCNCFSALAMLSKVLMSERHMFLHEKKAMVLGR